MEFGAGIEDIEAPIDLGLGLVPRQFQSLYLSTKGFLIGEKLSEATTGEDAEFDLLHPFGRLRTGFNQLPRLGVWWNSSRLAMRLASAAGKTWYRDGMRWVFKLSKTTRTSGTSG